MFRCLTILLIILSIGPIQNAHAASDTLAVMVAQATGRDKTSPNDSKSQSHQTSQTAIRKAWKDAYTTGFDAKAPGCGFDYGPNGMRNIYCYVSSVFSYAQLVRLSGMSPYVQGPHTNESLDLNASSSFGHYNPEFVVWLNQNLIPASEDQDFHWVTSPLYQQFLKKTARTYWLAYQIVFADSNRLNEEKRGYEERMAQGNAGCQGFSGFHKAFPDKYYKEFLDDDYYFGNVAACAFAFWIRRHMDGTWQEFHGGLKKLLATYDQDFLAAVPDKKAGGKEVCDPQKKPEVKCPILKRFLDDLAAGIKNRNWDMVLTFFDSDNYLAQKKLGIDKAQYIEEGLGLGFQDNHLIPLPEDSSEYAKLNSIVSVTFLSIKTEGEDRVTVTGQVQLFDGSTRKIELYIRQTPTGAYVIEPAVG